MREWAVSPTPYHPTHRKMRATAVAFPPSQLKMILCMDQATLPASSPLYSALELLFPGSTMKNRPLPSLHYPHPQVGPPSTPPALCCCKTNAPSFSARPPAKLKWIAELGFHNLGIQPFDDAKLLTTRQEMMEAAAAAAPL